jgi:NADPH:quinone reductase-like Zn-dependent oxidoreductase
LKFTDGAAIPEAFITAWDALVEQADLRAGETVLIHAAGSGVGTAAVQVAHAVGASVIGTARTADKLERARPLGLDKGVHVERGGRFAPSILTATAGRGVDVVLDLVGGPYLAENLACVAPCARIIQVGLLAGPLTELDLGRLMNRRIRLIGTILRARPVEEKIAAVQQMARHLLPLFGRSALCAIVNRVFPLTEAAAAHVYVASNSGFGKVVLAVS